MLSGRRRIVAGVAVAIAALVLGRWTATFATWRLWEARVSEPAAVVGTRFALQSAGLELLGIGIAVAWFAGHFAWVVRSVLQRSSDPPRSLDSFSERTVYLGAVTLGAVLGVVVGGGTGQWLGPLLLARSGVEFGVTDPRLSVDLGVFAARLPFWELLYQRGLALVIPALIAVTIVGAIGGTLKIADRRLWLAPALRWQLGLLLVSAAVLVGWAELLAPYRLAAERSSSLGPAEFLLRVTVSQVVVLFAAIAALTSLLWGIRFRFGIVLAGWVLLALAELGGTILVGSRATEAPLAPPELALLRQVDSVAYGIRLTQGAELRADSAAPSLWDRAAVARAISVDSFQSADAWPGTVRVGGQPTRVWFLIRTSERGDPIVVAVTDDHTGPTGGVASLRWGDDSFSPGVVPFVTLSRHHARPGAPQFDLDPAAVGVALSSAPRRIAVAWALQTGSVLQATPNQRIAWLLDPVARLARVAPFADWTRPRVAVVDRDVYWVSDGFLIVPRFPSSRTVLWRDREVSYARVGFLGVVRSRGGEARIYLRPDADSLASAWARIAEPVVEPAGNLPPALALQIGVGVQSTLIAAQVIQGSGWLGQAVARIGRRFYPADELPNAGLPEDPHRIPFVSDDGQRVTGLLRAPVADGATAGFSRTDSGFAVAGPRDLQQRWDRFPLFQQLRDSVRAAGSEFVPGVIRFGSRGDTLLAYQPNYALTPGRGGTVVLVNVALGNRLGSNRSYEEAWQNLRGEVGPAPVGTDTGVRLEQARQWLDRADAALKRGDLLEFARAFAYLRELLRPGAAADSGTSR